jgi:hypothetical protein
LTRFSHGTGEKLLILIFFLLFASSRERENVFDENWPQLVLQELNNYLLKMDIVNGNSPEKNVTFVFILIKNNI